MRVAEFNETTSFQDQLAAVSAAGVYVSVHTSNLANAPFLRPGAAVVELLQRNWVWHGLDKSFQARPPMPPTILWHEVTRVQYYHLPISRALALAPRTNNARECRCSTFKTDVILDLAAS